MIAAAQKCGSGASSPEAAQPPIRLMLVDDSSVARAVLSRMISSHADLDLLATAGSAAEALDALRSTPVDIVLLDVEMPGASGLEALPDILRAGRGARVLIVSSMAEDGADTAVRALALGATDTLPKPGAGTFGGRFSEVLAERLRRIGRATCRTNGGVEPQQPIRLREAPSRRLDCLALGASTGGLHALNSFLRALPERIGVPILVTQHLPPVFMPHFARQVEAASGRCAIVAECGQKIMEDRIHIAPGDAHLCVERGGESVRVRLRTSPAPSGCLPSADPMFASVADCYGSGATGVILSGMGRDGLLGSRRMADAGGTLFAQDRHSAAVWGMPKAIAEAGLASAVLPPAELARRIAARVEAK